MVASSLRPRIRILQRLPEPQDLLSLAENRRLLDPGPFGPHARFLWHRALSLVALGGFRSIWRVVNLLSLRFLALSYLVNLPIEKVPALFESCRHRRQSSACQRYLISCQHSRTTSC